MKTLGVFITTLMFVRYVRSRLEGQGLSESGDHVTSRLHDLIPLLPHTRLHHYWKSAKHQENPREGSAEADMSPMRRNHISLVAPRGFETPAQGLGSRVSVGGEVFGTNDARLP